MSIQKVHAKHISLSRAKLPLLINLFPKINLSLIVVIFLVGSKYPPNTIYNIVTRIQWYHLRDECKRPEINLISPYERMFASFRATLDVVLKKGMGDVKHTEK